MMKKISLIVAFCALSLIIGFAQLSFAQESCQLCGDWKGAVWRKYAHNREGDETKGYNGYDVRRGRVTCYLRINKYGDEYKIKKKCYYDDTGDTRYEDDYDIEILETTDTSIYYIAVDNQYDPDINQWGSTLGYTKIAYFYLITFYNGYLHCELTEVRELYYDLSKRYGCFKRLDLSEWDFDRFYDIDLYKEEKDW